MLRFFALVLACLFMLSHGSLGEAAPHVDHHEAHGAGTVLGDVHDSLPEPDEPSSDVGDVTHVHIVVAMPEPQAAKPAEPLEPRALVEPQIAAALTSRAVAPLLEPPSA